MANIVIRNLPENKELGRQSMAKMRGGYYHSPYNRYISRYLNILRRPSSRYGTNSFGSPIGAYGYRGYNPAGLILNPRRFSRG